jgi:divalent metal cation (Fe/Co/Zn/Cd) transporter
VEATRDAAIRRGSALEVAGMVWMLAEAVLAMGAGVAARSVLLTAFGLDSVIELLSGWMVLRQLRRPPSQTPEPALQRGEAMTARVSGVLLILLCLYIVASSIAGLVAGVRPGPSALGLAVSAVAVVAMPLLAVAKSRVNRVVNSASLRADIAQTVSCAFLAAVTLAGLVASVAFGLWWVQYVASLALLLWLVPEAREAMAASRGQRSRASSA